ncbi:MAG: protein kinase, partial [Thermoanaerobaculia bacterium]
PYEITGKLGEGGMGEVYRATDTHLKREVAIKVLPAAFTEDKERLARFEREAQLLAQLNHPNIAQIYGLEKSGDQRALVMELVEGPTLDERLASGPFSLTESLSLALQLALALEEAHEKGIVHRDLKPQNIKASSEGKVKVLDFGLAKAMDPVGASSSAADLARSPTLMNSPTQTSAGTQLGMILGTAGYMAPEQAKGFAVDKRADIWAFGVVLYEMLAGRSLFGGDSVGDTLAAVIRAEIDFSRLPEATPPAVRRLLRRCLERNPRNRLHDIADARIVLEDVVAGRSDELPAPAVAVAGVAAQSTVGRALPWIAGLALGAALLAVVDRTVLAPAPVEPPTLVSLTYSGKDVTPAASPDGKMIAFASTRDGSSRIWLKQLASGEEVAITSGPADSIPKFSPDGSSLLFLRGTAAPFELYRVSTVGGEPRRITTGVASGPTWSPDGRRIAIGRSTTSSGLADSLVTLSTEGNEEHEVARVADLLLLALNWSPDGARIGAWAQLRSNFAAQQSILEFDATTGDQRTIYQASGGTLLTGWAWCGPDAIVVAEAASQSGRGGNLLRRVERGAGTARTLMSLQNPVAWLDVAGSGRIVVGQTSPTQNLAEWTLAGNTGSEPPAVPSRWLTRGASVDRQPVLSLDALHLAFNSDRGGNLDIWELETSSGAVRRLTVSAGDDWDPAFTHDGKQLLWSSNRSGNFEVWIAASDGSGARKLTADGVDAENPTATPDGKWIVYASANPAQNGVWKIRFDGSGAERLAAGPMTVPELSPDGRWISFVDIDANRLRVIALDGGAELVAAALPPPGLSAMQFGRSRWLPGSSRLGWLHSDPTGANFLVAQEIAPGRDTSSSRQILARGTPDAPIESFAISPDGLRLFVSILQNRSDLLLIEGLPGVTR